ncbi:MAG: hypothetical protein CSB01_02280 [Bacteroidia bacterium]|nr:MAG: hypothetical protein CSB01_02280 [Bacteroidia bacterium]
MKAKLIKIAILLPLCFFGIIWSCDNEITDFDFYNIDKISVNISQKKQKWQNIKIETTILGKYDHKERVSMLIKDFSSNSLMASCSLEIGKRQFITKIKDIKLQILNDEKDLTSLLLTDFEQNKSAWIKKFNDGFEPNDKTATEILTEDADYSLSVATNFHFKEEPKFLKDKDIQLKFSVITTDEQVFSATSKKLHLNW